MRAYIKIEETPNGYFYPRIKDSRTVTTEEIIKELTQKSTLTGSDVKAVLTGLSEILVMNLKEGNRVRLDELGEFHLTQSIEKPFESTEEKDRIPAPEKPGILPE